MINCPIFQRPARSVQPGDDKNTSPNVYAGVVKHSQARTHAHHGNTPGLSLQGYAGRRMKPERRLGSSAVRSSVVLVIIATIACLSATLTTCSLRCSMEGQPPRNHTASIATGSLDCDSEEVSDFVRDSDDSDDDGLSYRPAAYQACLLYTSPSPRD